MKVFIQFFDPVEHKDFGTFKTLSTDRAAMHTMAGILADFIIEFHSFVAENKDYFN